MDNGAVYYRRFLEGDRDAIIDIISSNSEASLYVSLGENEGIFPLSIISALGHNVPLNLFSKSISL